MSKKKKKKAKASIIGLYPPGAIEKPEAALTWMNEALDQKPRGFVVFTVKKNGEIDTCLYGAKVTRYDLAWMGSYALKLAMNGWGT